jgi:hypothetical protein
MPTPTETDVNEKQVFKKVPVKVMPYETVKSAPPLKPNPFTALPVRKKGKVVLPEGWTGA